MSERLSGVAHRGNRDPLGVVLADAFACDCPQSELLQFESTTTESPCFSASHVLFVIPQQRCTRRYLCSTLIMWRCAAAPSDSHAKLHT